MIVKILAFWIIIQLVLIGIASTEISNEITRGEYDCNRERKIIPKWVGISFPLIVFMNADMLGVNEYCATKVQ